MANFAWFARMHRFVYHHSKGAVGGNLAGKPMVLMYTIGAVTGQIRQVPMLYFKFEEENIYIVASNNGQPKLPSWYYNLKTNPKLDVLIGRSRCRVHAEEVSAELHTELWPKIVDRHFLVGYHARKAGRHLPIISLRKI